MVRSDYDVFGSASIARIWDTDANANYFILRFLIPHTQCKFGILYKPMESMGLWKVWLLPLLKRDTTPELSLQCIT